MGSHDIYMYQRSKVVWYHSSCCNFQGHCASIEAKMDGAKVFPLAVRKYLGTRKSSLGAINGNNGHLPFCLNEKHEFLPI